MIPDLNTARRLLEEGWQRNPGPWKNHSLTAAHCAKTIAERLKMRGNNIDPEKACILGMLHDIGRREGVTWLAHTIDGYDYLMSLGYEKAARICLTHSFPEKDVNTYIGRHDISAEDEQRLVTLLQSFEDKMGCQVEEVVGISPL